MEKSYHNSRLVPLQEKCNKSTSSSPPTKRIRSALSPINGTAFQGRRDDLEKNSKSQLSFSQAAAPFIDSKSVSKEGLLDNSHLSTSYFPSTPKQSIVPSYSDLNPLKIKSEILESPLKRHLHSLGIESATTKLGKGSFGTVVLGFWQDQNVAVKVIGGEGNPTSKRRQKASIESELNVKKLAHPNIVKIFATFEGENEVKHSIIVMEFVGLASLQNVIEEHPHLLTNSFIQSTLCQISSALAHCHERNLVHLDVKPSNVLVSSSGVCKLADFGCSKDLEKVNKENCNSSKSGKSSSSLPGTAGFVAPELLQNACPTTKCDVFSFGIMMWQIFAKERMPFPGMHMHTIMFKVVSESYRPNETLLSAVPKVLKDLVTSCWAQKPRCRPTMNHVTKVLSQFRAASTVAKCLKRPASFRL